MEDWIANPQLLKADAEYAAVIEIDLAAMCSLICRIPTVAEYMEQIKAVNAKSADGTVLQSAG